MFGFPVSILGTLSGTGRDAAAPDFFRLTKLTLPEDMRTMKKAATRPPFDTRSFEGRSFEGRSFERRWLLVRSGRLQRESGVALLLVMIIFIVLYMIVYQLHFSTRMEEKIAEVRYGEVEAASALYSTGLYVMTLLVEDLKQDLQEQADPTGGGGPAGGAGAVGTRNGMPSLERATVSGGGAAPNTMGAGGSKVWHDYLRENIFLDNQQQVGNVSVKIVIRDGESKLNLNLLFDYPYVEEEIDQVTGEEGEEGEIEPGSRYERNIEAANSRIEQSLSRIRQGSSDTEIDDAIGDAVEGAVSPEAVAQGDLDSYEPEEPFLEPLPSKVRAAEEMLTRLVEMMIQLNLDNGFFYEFEPIPDVVAQAISDYVMERRSLDFNNRVLYTSELLNHVDISEEVFYGPRPQLLDGEEQYGDFILRRDEYGDIQSEYLYSDQYQGLAEEESQYEMANLMQEYGRFADFGGIPGLDRLQANGLTRGMTDLPVDLDEFGEEIVVEPPQPIGLVDLFTTFSEGKINLNTVHPAIVYGLLLSLDQEEAWKVALDLRDYRNRFQEYEEEEGVERVEGTGTPTPDLGQPKRPLPPDEEDPEYEDEFLTASYQDMETNYFTSLQQIELIDGNDEGPEDLLRSAEQVRRVSVEDRSLLQRVTNDLQPVAVFGGTYFDVKLKAKAQSSRSVKVGHLTLKRDPNKGLIEVVMWKEQQR